MTFPGQVATLVVPAEFAWSEAEGPAAPAALPAAPKASDAAIDAACAALKKDAPAALFLGGQALRADCLEQAGRIAAATGARLICETFPARIERGAGRVPVERLPYFGEMAAEYLKPFSELIMVGAKPPVSFFAYPGKPAHLTAPGTEIIALADAGGDLVAALDGLMHSGAFASHETNADGSTTLHSANGLLVARVVQGGASHDSCAIRAGNIPNAKLKVGQSAARLATGLDVALGRERPSLTYPTGAQIMHMDAYNIRVAQPADTVDVVEISLSKS